jgi:hypothetical protein
MSLEGEIGGDIGSLGEPITAYLYEGNVTLGTAVGRTGRDTSILTYSAGLKVGDRVELFDDAALTYRACRGLPVVRKVATAATSITGEIVSIDPARGMPANDTPVTALATMLSQDLLRRATIEFEGLRATKLIEQLIPQNSPADSQAVGAPATLAWDINLGAFKYVASGGAGLTPLFHIAGSTEGDVTAPQMVAYGLILSNKVS